MKEIMNSLSNNGILLIAILIFIFGLILLSYLLTIITSSRNNSSKKLEVNTDEQNNDLEVMLDKMQKTLDEKEKIDNISHFEEEQETNAIISYQELLKAAKKDFPQMEMANENKIDIMKTDNQMVPNENVQEINEKIEPDAELMVEKAITNKEIYQQQVVEDNKKFRNSIFISPIYGALNNEKKDTNKELEENISNVDSKYNHVAITEEYDELEYEKRQNNQFLEDLKNFRNNL